MEAAEGFAGAVAAGGAVAACHFGQRSVADMSAKRGLAESILCKRY